jgi:Alkylmercury lyase
MESQQVYTTPGNSLKLANMSAERQLAHDQLDERVRLFVYQHILRRQKSPTVAEIAKALACSTKRIRDSLSRLSESHAFMLQANGELWRAAPFSCIATSFPVTVGKFSWFANCIWDALGIPAMLAEDAIIDASCGCCNYEMPVQVKSGRLVSGKGLIHIAVPAREWYRDVVFT